MEDPATSVPSSLWASLNSWFTSTVFFVLLNLMIATIVFTSNLPTQNNHQQQEQEEEQEPQKQPQIARSPSILHRLKSFNFYPQKSQQEASQDTHYQQHPLEVAATQYVFNQHFDFDSTNTDPNIHQIREIQSVSPGIPTSLSTHYDFNHMSQETGKSTGSDTTGLPAHYDFNHMTQGTGKSTGSISNGLPAYYNLNHMSRETGSVTGSISNGLPAHYDFDHMSRETGSVTGSISTGLRTSYISQEAGSDTVFELDPATGVDTGFDFEPAGDEHTDELQSLDEVFSRLKRGSHDRTQSDGSIKPKPATKMKKSTSLKVGVSNHEEVEIIEARRPATVKEKRSAAKIVNEDDVEVDLKADDFINKFRNDLKLQRIESIMRTQGASRGGGK